MEATAITLLRGSGRTNKTGELPKWVEQDNTLLRIFFPLVILNYNSEVRKFFRFRGGKYVLLAVSYSISFSGHRLSCASFSVPCGKLDIHSRP